MSRTSNELDSGSLNLGLPTLPGKQDDCLVGWSSLSISGLRDDVSVKWHRGSPSKSEPRLFCG